MDIAVLLATYNSENYLRVQINSLLCQTYPKFTLYIRDDGSSDSTLQIVKEYCTIHSNIILLEDSFKGRKAMYSFIWLLEHTKASYYMFCDHDDYWLPDKIEKTLAKMKQNELLNPNKAIVVNTDLQVVDEELKVIEPSFWKYSKINPAILSTFNYLSVCNSFTGCTMMINDYAKQLALPISNKAIMHDIWIALCVSAQNGVLVYLDEATILYRQHGNNVVGASEFGKKYLLLKFMSLKEVVSQNRRYFGMVRAIKKYPVIKYIWFKLLYFIKR